MLFKLRPERIPLVGVAPAVGSPKVAEEDNHRLAILRKVTDPDHFGVDIRQLGVLEGFRKVGRQIALIGSQGHTGGTLFRRLRKPTRRNGALLRRKGLAGAQQEVKPEPGGQLHALVCDGRLESGGTTDSFENDDDDGGACSV